MKAEPRGQGGSSEGARPRLLFLCQTLPYPPDGGVHIRSYNVMRLLSRVFDITALCFYRVATRPTPQQVRESVMALREFAHVEAFPIPQEHSRARLVGDHLRSIASMRVYTRFAYESASFRRRLQELLATEHFDLVHLDSLDLSAYLPVLQGLPVVCTHHNVESALLRRRAGSESSSLMRRYLEFQAYLMEREEKAWCGRINLNVTVSAHDAAVLSTLVPQSRICVVPNGVDTRLFEPAPGDGNGIVFVGGYSWYPNRDGMKYFAEAILPKIRDLAGDASVTWVGRAPAEIRDLYLKQYGVRLTGYVPDIRPHVYAASCFVVPLRVGGGTRLKILDAWSMGMPVVSTSVGCEGLDARDGENILIRDDPTEFARAVHAVLTDSTLRQRLSAGARDTATGVYDWDVIGESMNETYMAQLGSMSADITV